MVTKRSEKKILQRYAFAGYLDFGSKKYTAADRVLAGTRLYIDYILGGGDGVKANDTSKIKVDGGGSGERSGFCTYHNQMYHWAMKSIPIEFRGVVRMVCIEDKEIVVSGSDLDIKRKLYAARVDLCRGLDRIVQFYQRKT